MSERSKSRRSFLESVSKVALAGTLLPMASEVKAESILEKTGEDVFRFSTKPYLQALEENEVTVVFITSNHSYSWVEYGERDFGRQAFSYSEGFVDANVTLNKITLTGLNAGTEYQYRVKSKPITLFDPYNVEFGEIVESAGGTFRTPSPKDLEVSCLILNDIHDRPYSFGELFKLCQGVNFDFVALNGDMFDFQTDEQQLIDHLIDPCTTLFASGKPFLMIRGNHETRGKYARQFKDYFSYPNGEYFFSFKRGPVHFIILDSGEDKPDTAGEYYGMVNFDPFREREADWLEKELQNPMYSDCKYKVVLMHIPPFHSGDWHGTMHCRTLFHPLFEKYQIDLVVSGHTHRYGVHAPSEEHRYPIIIGGGPKTGNRTVIQLQANTKQLQIKMIRDDGELVGEYVLE